MQKSVVTILLVTCVFTALVSGQSANHHHGHPASAHNHSVEAKTDAKKAEPPQVDGKEWLTAGLATTGDVRIERGQVVILNTDLDLNTLTIEGYLVCARQDLNIKAKWIMVHGTGGKFVCGSRQKPFQQKLTITLTGTNTTENVMGMGTKFLGAMMGGRIELYGENRTTWTKLGVTAQSGSNQITLADDAYWRVGERIVIASSSMRADEAETRTITAVSGRNLTLNQPLTYRHWGTLQTFDGKTLDSRAEVGRATSSFREIPPQHSCSSAVTLW
jgi:hypothetical protein